MCSHKNFITTEWIDALEQKTKTATSVQFNHIVISNLHPKIVEIHDYSFYGLLVFQLVKAGIIEIERM